MADQIDVIFPDLLGLTHGKTVPPGRLDHPTHYAITVMVQGLDLEFLDVPTYSTSSGFPDMEARVDLETLRPWIGGRRTAMASLYRTNGEPLPLDSRRQLQLICDRWAARGLTPIAGFEMEFFLLASRRPLVKLPVPDHRVYGIGAGADPSGTLEAIAASVDGLVTAHAAADYAEDWDVDGLLTEVHNYWPTGLTVDDLRRSMSSDELYELLMGDASALYERREAELSPEIMRDVERQVMLRIIDTRWREHLGEMDYLREGIHLRAMGQKDPAVEWQREGFEMFGHMMTGINDDFVRYITHVQVAVEEQSAPAEELRNVQYLAADDTSRGMAAIANASSDGLGLTADDDDDAQAVQQPVVKSDLEKTPRNAPCPCGSGKKFKLCHGR